MKFKIPEPRENIIVLIRKLGYIPKENIRGEFNCMRYLGGRDYPKFHLFLKREENDQLSFSLHLDQKIPSYKGTRAHSGEYEGELVEKEVERIKKIVEESK